MVEEPKVPQGYEKKLWTSRRLCESRAKIANWLKVSAATVERKAEGTESPQKARPPRTGVGNSHMKAEDDIHGETEA